MPPLRRGSGITAKSEPAYAAVRHRPIPCARGAAYIGSSVTTARSRFMSFALYIIGLLVLVGGIAWAMSTAGLATVYIGIACLIVLGIGIMMAVSRTRTKDPS
ncbi:Transmembrane protein [Cupriavidus oxalaticus]